MKQKEDKKEQVIQIIRKIKKEYEQKGGDLFLFLFHYFFPKIDTKSDYIQDSKNRYHSICSFVPTNKKSAGKKLELLAAYLKIEYCQESFFVYLDLESTAIPDDCKDKEFGTHFSFYGDESDYYYIPVRTDLALKDSETLAQIEKEQVAEFELITKITELFKEITEFN